ncbi:MAG TPA: helicase-related protein [Nitrososphaeraceae archaeon]|nr:helicase-related protein [Nitrososphaeraceae archaeon]
MSSPVADHVKYFQHPLLWDKLVELRSYQEHIALSSADRNSLVILPTSLGKTVVALLVCAEILYKFKDKRVLVMAPTRPLVAQHRMSFGSALKLPEEQTSTVTGKTAPEFRSAVWNQKQIRLVFATPEVVRNDLVEGRLSLSDFALLVFDEAHRAVKDYAYTVIAKYYVKQSSHPVLIGLTASPGADKDRVQEVCDNLSIENIQYRTEDDNDVKAYVNPIDVKWEWVSLPWEYTYVISLLRTVLEEKLKWLVQKGIVKKSKIEWIFKRDLIEAGELLKYNLELAMEEQRGPIYLALSNQSAALTLMYCVELMGSQGAYSLDAFLQRTEKTQSKGRLSMLADRRIQEVKTLLSGIQKEHPKILRLLELVELQRTKHYDTGHQQESSSKTLIFTQYRDSAKHITETLANAGFKSSRFVGQAKREGDEGMSQDEQASTLESFRNGEIDVLVATSIAEEGLDIPEVGLVIFYEPIPSEIRYIQRKGRTGRRSAGSVVILAANDTIDSRYHRATQRRVEMMHKRMKNLTSISLKQMTRLPIRPDRMTQYEVSQVEKRKARLEDQFTRKIELDQEEVTASPVYHQAPKDYLQRLEAKRKQVSSALHEDLVIGRMKRDIQRAMKVIYLESLKAGKQGIDTDDLREEYHLENLVLIEAIRRLEKLNKVQWLDDGRLTAAESLKKYPGKAYSIYVEKVLSGKALLLIDGKYHVRLNHYDYDGPRALLKTGSEFKAIGDLYWEKGVLTLRIRQIIHSN